MEDGKEQPAEQWAMMDDLSWYQIFEEVGKISFDALQQNQDNPDQTLVDSFELVAGRVRYVNGLLRVDGAIDHVPADPVQTNLAGLMGVFQLGVQFGVHMLKEHKNQLFTPQTIQ